MFRVCYDSGRILSSESHSWDQLPRKGVVWVIEYGDFWKDKRLMTVSCGYDYYHGPPGIYCSDERLSEDDLEGVLVSDEEFERLMLLVNAQVVSK